jgi:predicted glycosyltransferase
VPGSVLLYVQHLLGIGHLRRALYLTNAMTEAGLIVTLVTGGEPLPGLADVAAHRVVQLTPLRASDASFRNLIGANGQPPDDRVWSARRHMLLSAFTEARPDALVIEAYPFGRRAFRAELDPLIAAARGCEPRPLVLCSLRDIVVAPPHERRGHEIVARVRGEFDAVLVHGDPRLIGLDASFPLAAQIADRLVYTGYVAAPPIGVTRGDTAGAGEVLVSAGGGAVGGALLRTALEARRRGCLAEAGWRLLAGPNLPANEFSRLLTELPHGVTVERYRSDFLELLRRCRVSVSQAGYNTVLDVITAGVPAVLVPFAELRETEQTLRAERLAALGVVETLTASELSPDRLCRAIGRAVHRGPDALQIDTTGARRTAEIIAALITDRSDPKILQSIQHAGQ